MNLRTAARGNETPQPPVDGAVVQLAQDRDRDEVGVRMGPRRRSAAACVLTD
jgi:hypothetical protein